MWFDSVLIWHHLAPRDATHATLTVGFIAYRNPHFLVVDPVVVQLVAKKNDGGSYPHDCGVCDFSPLALALQRELSAASVAVRSGSRCRE